MLQLIQVTKSRIEVFRGQTCLDNSSLGLRSRVILDCVMFMFKLTIMKFSMLKSFKMNNESEIYLNIMLT